MMVKQYLSLNEGVIHKSVHDNVGEKVGKIDDVLIDPQSGNVKIAILSEGGILGLGSDHYALPFHMLRFNTNSADIGLKVERDHIKNAPEINVEKLRNNDESEIDKLVTYYGKDNLNQKQEGVDSDSYVGERHTNHHHQGYEGSAKITGEEPKNNEDSRPSEHMNYEKLKYGKE